jgi:hypothetical protein
VNGCANVPTSNEANMRLIEQMGIYPDRYVRERRPALRSVIQAVIATIRMQKFRQTWAVSKELRSEVARSVEILRREKQQQQSSARRRRVEGVVV